MRGDVRAVREGEINIMELFEADAVGHYVAASHVRGEERETEEDGGLRYAKSFKKIV